MAQDVKAVCAELIQNWARWRDQGRWAELSTTFHAGGTMTVTWFDGKFPEFIRRSKASYDVKQSLVKHHLGVSSIEVLGGRALAETNVTIISRSMLDGFLVDSTAFGRFLDMIEERDGRWAIANRVCIYEKDRLDPVVPSDAFSKYMASTDFAVVPAPYRYLGYRLIKAGHKLTPNLLCDGSDETERAYAVRRRWLRGDELAATA